MSSTAEPRAEPATEHEAATGHSDSGNTAASYTEMASNAATTAASTATSAVVGVKDNVFSMFGGGAKKDKKEDSEDAEAETSGSAKSKRDAEAKNEVRPVDYWVSVNGPLTMVRV